MLSNFAVSIYVMNRGSLHQERYPTCLPTQGNTLDSQLNE